MVNKNLPSAKTISRILEPYQYELECHFEKAYMANGPVHQIARFRDVYKTGVFINTELELDYDPLAIMMVAYLHDLFAWSRDNHHLLSYNYVLTTEDPFILEILDVLKKREEYGYYQTSCTISHRYMIAQACREHRTSYDDIFTNTFSELMNSAARGVPKDIKSVMQLAYRHSLDLNDHKTWPECMEIAVDHVKGRYCRTACTGIPGIYYTVYRDELNAFWDDVDNLKAEELMVNSLDHREIIWWEG